MASKAPRGSTVFGIILIAVLACSACTTGDPNVDTIFWSKKKAEKRLAAERQALEAEQQKEATLVARRDELQVDQRRVDEQRGRVELLLAILRMDIAKIEELIREAKTDDSEEMKDLRTKLAQLQLQSDAVKGRGNDLDAAGAKAVADIEQQIKETSRRVRAILQAAGS